MNQTVLVQIGGNNPATKFDTTHALRIGDRVIVETSNGAEWGVVSGEVKTAKQSQSNNMVLRVCDDADNKTIENLERQAKNAFRVAEEKIAKYKLDMKLISTHYTFDANKVIMNFFSENRVDFRELVKDLAYSLRARIELRQVGARDEAKLVGGLGSCGMECCCKRFLNDFENVSIKMAKNQNISLNPQKINGACGRLLCCLGYENDHYCKMQEKMPRYGSEVQTPDGRGYAQDNHILKETVNVKFVNGDISTCKCYNLCDLKCKQRNSE